MPSARRPSSAPGTSPEQMSLRRRAPLLSCPGRASSPCSAATPASARWGSSVAPIVMAALVLRESPCVTFSRCACVLSSASSVPGSTSTSSSSSSGSLSTGLNRPGKPGAVHSVSEVTRGVRCSCIHPQGCLRPGARRGRSCQPTARYSIFLFDVAPFEGGGFGASQARLEHRQHDGAVKRGALAGNLADGVEVEGGRLAPAPLVAARASEPLVRPVGDRPDRIGQSCELRAEAHGGDHHRSGCRRLPRGVEGAEVFGDTGIVGRPSRDASSRARAPA